MAMNRIMTMAEKEVRDYAQRQMERAEQRENIVFTEKQKEQVLEYAAMTGDDYNIRKMVRNLADAVRSSDEEKVDEILWDARAIIDAFPDRSVGMAELKGYGYTADDMLPLRQEMALELHRVGEKVYCLQSDGSHGDYASREMILEHEGLYGIEKEAWQRMQEQEDEIDFEEAGLNGMCRSEIEETVWAIAQAEIIENDLDARIQAVRVYGSRTRDGLYNEESDVDVVIAYEGTAREDDLFSVLNEVGYKVGNMKVDMNPIRLDKTGTLEDFLERSERYLDEKTEQMKARGEYKPLAKQRWKSHRESYPPSFSPWEVSF